MACASGACSPDDRESIDAASSGASSEHGAGGTGATSGTSTTSETSAASGGGGTGGGTCGNGSVDAGEECDGGNVGGADCTTLGLGFTGGQLACDGCSFDTSACTAGCPDGNCALRFDGLDDYVVVPHAPALVGGGAPLTVEAWVYYDDITANCMTAVRKGTAASATYDYWLHKNWDPAENLFWGSYASHSVVGGPVASNGWFHLAGVYDPSIGHARLYVNGIQVGQQATVGTPAANSDELRIGIDWDFGCAMLGVIDEVRISSVARYSAAFTPVTTFVPDPSTIALYHFDEYTGAVATDSSGNGHHGTIAGATWTTEHP